MNFLSDEYYMREALKEAQLAFKNDEVPVGSIVVMDNIIIARTFNMTEQLKDTTAHAEMLAITAASNYLNSKILTDCVFYVTLEPCAMCAAAMSLSQIGRLVWGAPDPKKGYTLFYPSLLHPRTLVSTNVLADESSLLLKKFFRQKRKL